MTSALIGIDISDLGKGDGSTRAIHLETGGEINLAAPYLLTLVSKGEWNPGTTWNTVSGRDEMESLIKGGSIKSLQTRVSAPQDQSRWNAEKVASKEGWDNLAKTYDHAYLYSWRMGTLYYQGKALPRGMNVYELSHTLLGKFN